MKILSRINPICNKPKVLIRNLGSQVLNSCTIEFSVNGVSESMEWNGELQFLESEEVELNYSDPSIWWGDEDVLKTFEVTLTQPNGGVDENPSNNTGRSQFYPPVVHAYEDFSDDRLIIWVRTNGAPQETSYTLRDASGNVIFERDDFTIANENYRDTIPLDPGCYYFHLRDSDDDGMGFWANNDGNGTCRFKKVGSGTLITFENDFGKDVHHYFAWNIDPLNVDERFTDRSLKLYPNPSSGQVFIESRNIRERLDVEVYDVNGRKLLSFGREYFTDDMLNSFNLSELGRGLYLMRIGNENYSWTEKIMLE